MAGKRGWIYWFLWGSVSLGLMTYFGYTMFGDARDKTVFLPGQTSHGHHQIEMTCDVCHADSFAGREVMQAACMNCHAGELQAANDSHPKGKFTDPRNADRVEKLDARYCVTCHVEHRPEITGSMGVTVANDFCFHCHRNIAEERQTHAGMAFDTCADAGCHNFHDNRALYEDFLLQHMHEPEVRETALLPGRDLAGHILSLPAYPVQRYPFKRLTNADIDASPEILIRADAVLLEDWLSSTHAKAGVNCSACHRAVDGVPERMVWLEKPDRQACRSCHAEETKGFEKGKHGMRPAQGLASMQPGMARASMREGAAHAELDCSSCHKPHAYDTSAASVDACAGCHNDEHTLAYKNSKHYLLWMREMAGEAETGSGVSCAGCHMPRIEFHDGELNRVLVQHNQNDNLRPNEKMIRTSCMHCHGLGFSIDSLADRTLIKRNFAGLPRVHVGSIDMAETNMIRDKERR